MMGASLCVCVCGGALQGEPELGRQEPGCGSGQREQAEVEEG